MAKTHRTRVVLARGALLLALTLVFQSLRFLIPVPVFLSTFLIGTLVNMCLLVAVEEVGIGMALVIAAVTPLVAFLQQLLPLPVFILPVALGNALYVCCYKIGAAFDSRLGIGAAAAAKTLFLYAAFTWLLSFIAVNPRIAAGLMFVMSWPQLVTSLAGGAAALVVVRHLRPLLR